MPRESFPPGVAEQLDWYVYRLIDPRNGETFYVGKGKGNRIFSHARGLLASDEDQGVSDLKLQRVEEIEGAGLEVAHVVHRHGIKAERTAYEIEAALIDAYPGLTNRAKGHKSKDYGSRHVEEIIAEYAGEEFEVKEPLILISVGRSYYEKSVYDAVRTAWKIRVDKDRTYDLVQANLRGLVVGAFRPREWLEGTLENFPGLLGRDFPDRWGFKGEPAEPEIRDYYVRKRVPACYYKPGAANPIRYCDP